MSSSNNDLPVSTLLGRALARARGSILWERLWPALASLATAAGLFLAFSWAGFWLVLPPVGRAIGLLAFVLIGAAAAIPLFRLRLPNTDEGLRRLDRVSGEQHRPATAIADEMAAQPNDPVTRALWQAHVERARRSAAQLRAGWPTPHLSLRDPMALRALTLILVVAAFFAASGERGKRITAAFDWNGAVGMSNFRVDAWVTPPAYTGRPPVMLSGLRPGESTQAMDPVNVPSGSVLVVRATGRVGLDIVPKGGVEKSAPEASKQAGNQAPNQTPKQTSKQAPDSEERHFLIKSDGSVAVRGLGGGDRVWKFTAIPDRVPSIALVKDPERQARGATRLDYKMEDDYGVIEAQATFARKDGPAGSKPPRELFKAPDFALALPQARARGGVAQTIRDLSEHPWAGADVRMTLTAKDEGGNVGRSEPHEFQLPQRLFMKPVARALIEQRRNLALDANTRPVVLVALDALTIAPERFTPEASVYLGLRSIYWDLGNAKTDDALRDVVARMWAMAVQIEDGNVSETEQALRQAQEALRQALERGATDEELKKLMENLRAALDKFLQALAEEMRKNPQMARPLDRNSQTLRQQDLKSMLDRMEQMARSGQKDAARQLLDQMQSMLENLQMARPGQQQDGQDGDMNSALDELGDMIRKQQQLRDRTYKQGQDGKRQRGQQDNQQMGDLRQDQQALRDRLNKLLEQLRQRGQGNPGEGEDGQDPGQGQQGEGGQGEGELGEAGNAMGQADGQMGEGDADGAVGSQGRALEAMRKGAQGMAQSMQQQNGQGPGRGQPGRNGQARAQQDTDPLGRPLRGRDFGDDVTVKVPGEIDVQRARRILEELRRRFADPQRPQLELDYLERLLKDF